MYRLPLASSATATGLLRLALVAAPPSPAKAELPLPATVVMIPVAASTLRIRWLPESAMYRLPLASSATPDGTQTLALVAAPPSPAKVLMPLPATVVMIAVAAVTLRIRWLAYSAMYRLPPASTATPTGTLRLAFVAAPPSPAKPKTPLPATVVMIPVAAPTLRIRSLPRSAMQRLPPESIATRAGLLRLAVGPAAPSPA